MPFNSPNIDSITTATNQQREDARTFNRVDNDILTRSSGQISPTVSQPRYPRTEAFTDVINSRYSF